MLAKDTLPSGKMLFGQVAVTDHVDGADVRIIMNRE